MFIITSSSVSQLTQLMSGNDFRRCARLAPLEQQSYKFQTFIIDIPTSEIFPANGTRHIYSKHTPQWRQTTMSSGNLRQ